MDTIFSGLYLESYLYDHLVSNTCEAAHLALLWTLFERLAAYDLTISAVPLEHPDPFATTSTASVALDTFIGAVLQLWARGGWKLLTFLSQKLSVAERK